MIFSPLKHGAMVTCVLVNLQLEVFWELCVLELCTLLFTCHGDARGCVRVLMAKCPGDT